MNPIDGLAQCRLPRHIRAGMVAACAGLLVLAGLPSGVGAQQKPPQVQRPAPPPAVAAISITIGELPNISLPRESHGRLLRGSLQLPRRVGEALERDGLPARIEPAVDGSFTFPDDDELSFASFGEPNDQIVERIRAGYPKLPVPFVFMTLAERGQYLIAAAYVITEDAAGQKTLHRADRRIAVAKDIASKTLLETWPGCMAAAIGRFVRNEKNAQSQECQEAEGASKPPAHASGGPPAKVATKGGEKDSGLLDGIPDDEKVRIWKKEQLAGAAPVNPPKPGAPPAASPRPDTSRIPSEPSASATPEAHSRTVSYRLIEQAFRYGIACCQRRERLDAVTRVMRRLINAGGSEGQCLRTFEQRIGVSRPQTELWMRRELWQGSNAFLRGNVVDVRLEYQIWTEQTSSESLSNFARRCTPPELPIHFTARLFELFEQSRQGSHQGKKRNSAWQVQSGPTEVKYDTAMAALHNANRDHQQAWSLPNAIEALAMMDLLKHDYRSLRFWALADERPAVFFFDWVRVSPKEQRFISDFNLTPEISSEVAILIGIERHYAPQ